jgi:hypothetical protein
MGVRKIMKKISLVLALVGLTSGMAYAQAAPCAGTEPGGVAIGNPIAAGNNFVDRGFETGGIPNTFWNPETSTNFGTPLCDSSCGTGGGASPPRTGAFWAWFGGVAAPETATLGQTITFVNTGAAQLEFYMRIGTVSAAFTDVLNVRVDGAIVNTYPEPTVAETTYTQRVVNLNAFANGLAHTIVFEYIGPTSGTGSYVVDDVVLCDAAVSPVELMEFSIK